MLHRPQLGSKKTALSLGLAMLALLAGTSPSSGSEGGISNEGCSAVQLLFRVPISRVEDLVPEPFTIKEAPDSPDETILVLQMERCDRMIIEGHDAGSFTQFTATVDIEHPREFAGDPPPVPEPNAFALLGATDNHDLIRYLRQQGAAGPGSAEPLSYEMGEDGSFVFEARSPHTASPFRVTARVAPTTPEGTGIPLEPHGYAVGPRGVLIVDSEVELRYGPVIAWQIKTDKESLLDRILCDGPRSSTDPRAAARPADPAHANFDASVSVRLFPTREIGPIDDVECPTAG